MEDGELLSTAFRPILPTWLMSWFWTDDTFLTQSYLIFQAVIGGFSIFIAYLLISQIFSSRIAFITSLWGVFSPFMLQFSSTLLTEPVFTVLTLGGIYFLKSKNSALASAFFALSALTRPIILPFLAFVMVFYGLIYFVYRIDTIIPYLKTTFLTIIFTLLLISPWCIRNSLLFKSFTLTQSSGYGTNLLYGTEEIGVIGDDVWSWILKKYPIVHGGNEILIDRERGKLALDIIKQNPQQYLKARISQYPRLIIDSNSYILMSYNQSAGQLWQERKLLPLFFKVSNVFLSIILFGLFIIGLIILGKKSLLSKTFFIWSFPLFFCLIHLPMWIETRYFYPAYLLYLAIAIWTADLIIMFLVKHYKHL